MTLVQDDHDELNIKGVELAGVWVVVVEMGTCITEKRIRTRWPSLRSSTVHAVCTLE